VQKTIGSQFTSELRLNAQEMRALSRVDGARSLRQLVQTFPQDAETLQRLVFLLKELQGLSFRSAPPVLERKTPAPIPSARQPAPPEAEKTTEAPAAVRVAGSKPKVQAVRAPAVAAPNPATVPPPSAAPAASSNDDLVKLRAQ